MKMYYFYTIITHRLLKNIGLINLIILNFYNITNIRVTYIFKTAILQ